MINLLKPYWGVNSVPNSRFQRDRLKCTIDKGTFCFLSVNEVKEHITHKRIDAYKQGNLAGGPS